MVLVQKKKWSDNTQPRQRLGFYNLKISRFFGG